MSNYHRAFRFLLSSAAATVACATNAQIYVPPSDGPLAEITLVSSVPDSMDFIVYAQAEDCRGTAYVQRPSDQKRTTKVRANRLTAFAVGFGVNIGCPISFRFTPRENAKYLVSYDKQQEGDVFRGGKATCQLLVQRVQDDGQLEMVEETEQLRIRQPFFQSGAWCEAKH